MNDAALNADLHFYCYSLFAGSLGIGGIMIAHSCKRQIAIGETLQVADSKKWPTYLEM
jgi:hypothetical protein